MASKDNFKKNSLFIGLFFLSIFILIYIAHLFASPKDKKFYQKEYDDLKTLVEKQFKKADQQQKYFNDPDKKIEIVFWHNLYPEEKEVLDKVIKQFEKTYRSIKIKEVNKSNWGNIAKSVANALPVNKQPNLVFSYPDHVEFYSKSHKVVPLDIFMQGDDANIKGQFYTTYLKKNTLEHGYDGGEHYYSFPFSKTTETLFYNKDMFKDCRNVLNRDLPDLVIDENGVISPKDESKGLTWEQLEIIAEKMKELKKNVNGFIPIVLGSEANLLNTAFQQSGIKFPTTQKEAEEFLRGEKVQEVIKYFKEKFYNTGYMTTSKMNGEQKALDMFCQKKSSIFIDSTRMVHKVQESDLKNVGLSKVPLLTLIKEECKYKNVMQGANINMFYSSEKDEMLASWLFLKTLTSRENLIDLLNATGGLNITRTDIFNQVDNKINDPSKSSPITIEPNTLHFASLQYAYNNQKTDDKQEDKMFFETPIFSNSNFLRTVLSELFTYVLAIDQSITKDALKNEIKSLCAQAATRIETN
ncbi:ABC transporter substrate-binding protein [Vaccinium witches'-broom phytoplasma]|uniref:ABC transporter substrate-binding protein n=1 Tax=Vaccinium witches'-broom phytoplasma TaxID=85642 RepID=UPI00036A301D|nr:extracellular solute-binding protein [Vaccinium witches'-broom phytoplasma]